jgi:hypothetical protein
MGKKKNKNQTLNWYKSNINKLKPPKKNNTQSNINTKATS